MLPLPDTFWKKVFVFSFFPVLVLVVAFGMLGTVEKDAAANPLIATGTPTTLGIFQNINLQAGSAYVLDIKNNKVLFEKDANNVRPLASLTKLMTAFTADQTMSPTSTITISKEALAETGDNGLRAGEQWDLKTLLNFTLLTSSNDGAAAIAESAAAPFISEMNTEAAFMDLSTLRFKNPTGLDITGADGKTLVDSGGWGSAKDVAGLAAAIFHADAPLVEITRYPSYTFKSLNGIVHRVTNTDTVLGKIPGVLMSKTGYTDLAGGNLVVTFDEEIGHPIVIVVLGSTYDGRFSDMVALASSTRAYFTQ